MDRPFAELESMAKLFPKEDPRSQILSHFMDATRVLREDEGGDLEQTFAQLESVAQLFPKADPRSRVLGNLFNATRVMREDGDLSALEKVLPSVHEQANRSVAAVNEWNEQKKKESWMEGLYKTYDKEGGTGFMNGLDRAGLQRGVAEEMYDFVANAEKRGVKPPTKTSFDGWIHDPPTLDSKTMEEVKALPVVDKTYLIYKVNGHEDADDQDKVVFFVFLVHVKRFGAGKDTKIFERVAHLCCFQHHSHQKNILSSFVLACQHPYVPAPGFKQQHPAARPQQVLLQSVDEASDPQLRTFFSMMGCTDVKVADPKLIALLRRTRKEDYVRGKAFSRDENSYLYDVSRRTSCGGCGLVGPKLKRCPCGKAHYCSKECQGACWKEHRPAHQLAMQKKAEKESSK